MFRWRLRFGRRRAAFTLVEVMIVISVIATLVALLLPALQLSREAARRSTCRNNCAQLGLALFTYECSHQSLPSGVVNPTGPVLYEASGLHTGWIVQILPHIEQAALYGRYNFKRTVYSPANHTVASCTLAVLSCPSDPLRGNASSYVGCHHDVESPIAADNNGMLFLNSSIQTATVPDGLTNTFVLGETKTKMGSFSWASGTRATLRNTGSLATPTAPDEVGTFSSYHSGGFHFVFGDASVHFISENIDEAIYQRMGNRRDGSFEVDY